MGVQLVGGILKGALVAAGAAAGFVAFGVVGGYVLAAGEFQVTVAGGMGLLAAVTVHRVLAITEIPRFLTRPSGRAGTPERST